MKMAKKRSGEAAKERFSKYVEKLIQAHPEISDDITEIAESMNITSKLDVMFRSDSAEWETPGYIFDRLDSEFHFTLDPAATDQNHKCFKYYTKLTNGLDKSWAGHRVFVNPPYGKEIPKWVEKSYLEGLKGTLVVMLIPARTDTAWWHDYVMRAEIRFIKGRIGFINRTISNEKKGKKFKISKAPFPSAIIIFGNGKRKVSSYQFKSNKDLEFKQTTLI